MCLVLALCTHVVLTLCTLAAIACLVVPGIIGASLIHLWWLGLWTTRYILWLIINFWSLKRVKPNPPGYGYEKNNLLACEWRGHRRAFGVHCCVDDLSHKSCTLLKINLDLMMPSLVSLWSIK